MAHRKLFWQVNHPNVDRILFDPKDGRIVSGVAFSASHSEWVVRRRVGDDFVDGDRYRYDLREKAQDAAVAAAKVASDEEVVIVPEPRTLVDIYEKAFRNIIAGDANKAKTIARAVMENPSAWLEALEKTMEEESK